MTEQELIRAISTIRGVKSVTIDVIGVALVRVNVRYRLWTYLIPGGQKKICNKVQKFIDFVCPIGLTIEVDYSN